MTSTRSSAAAASLPLKEFAGLTAEGAFLNHKHTYSYGTHAAHITVDAKTRAYGRFSITSWCRIVGRAINPLTVRGQLIGSLVQGLGGAVLEDLEYDEQGQFLTGSLADYLLPTAWDFPKLRCFVTDDHPSPINPLGAKGGGRGRYHRRGGVHGERGSGCVADRSAWSRAHLPLSPSLRCGSWCRTRGRLSVPCARG